MLKLNTVFPWRFAFDLGSAYVFPTGFFRHAFTRIWEPNSVVKFQKLENMSQL